MTCSCLTPVTVSLKSTTAQGCVTTDLTNREFVVELLDMDSNVQATTVYSPSTDRKVKGRRSKAAENLMFAFSLPGIHACACGNCDPHKYTH